MHSASYLAFAGSLRSAFIRRTTAIYMNLKIITRTDQNGGQYVYFPLIFLLIVLHYIPTYLIDCARYVEISKDNCINI